MPKQPLYFLLIFFKVCGVIGFISSVALYLGTFIYYFSVPTTSAIPFPVYLLFPLFGIWPVITILLMANSTTRFGIFFSPNSFLFKYCPYQLLFAMVGALIFAAINFAYIFNKYPSGSHLTPNEGYRVMSAVSAAFYVGTFALSYAFANKMKSDQSSS